MGSPTTGPDKVWSSPFLEVVEEDARRKGGFGEEPGGKDAAAQGKRNPGR
jgi:hypothetical protein